MFFGTLCRRFFGDAGVSNRPDFVPLSVHTRQEERPQEAPPQEAPVARGCVPHLCNMRPHLMAAIGNEARPSLDPGGVG